MKRIRLFKKWIYVHPYSVNDSGFWPFRVWFYVYENYEGKVYGLGFHWLIVADAHIEIMHKSRMELGLC